MKYWNWFPLFFGTQIIVFAISISIKLSLWEYIAVSFGAWMSIAWIPIEEDSQK